MFTQRLSMDCTKEQYEKYLKDELLKMGYIEKCMYWGRDIGIFTNACNGISGGMLDICEVDKEAFNRHYLGSFNAPLFLALAAMTDKPEGNYGEYWICIRENSWFTEDKLYKSIGVYHDKSPMFYDNKGAENGAVIKHLFKYFRKATKEEIMAKFGEKKWNHNTLENKIDQLNKNGQVDFTITLDAIEIIKEFNRLADDIANKKESDAINLLKSKGYKILKPKTWEEV